MPWTKIKADQQEPSFHCEATGETRNLAYAEATREGLRQALAHDPTVFVMGQGVDDPGGMFGTTRNLHKEFGSDRVFDTPLAETALAGIAVGAAIAGMRPVYFHNRPDFLLLASDQLINHASKWHYMFGGQVPVPVVFWACIGRGWGSGAQHSQALQGLFAHVPGLKVVMPSTCFDAKGLLIAAIADPNPVLILDHRYNFKQKGPVPEDVYKVPLGKGIVRRVGSDVTIVAVSHLVVEAYKAAEELASEGISAEIIDPRTIRPFDEDLLLQSVKKTGRLVITDIGWKTGGITAEISAMVAEKGFSSLRAPIIRVAAPDLPTPASPILEEAYYFGKEKIAEGVRRAVASG